MGWGGCVVGGEDEERRLGDFVVVQSAWDREVSVARDGRADSEEEARYRRVLSEGFAEYRRKHEEQYQLVETGSFVRELAASLSRMPSLRFLDVNNPHENPAQWSALTAATLRTVLTPSFLASPVFVERDRGRLWG